MDTTTPAGTRRLRRVAKICEAYGLRVQKSGFEIVCTQVDWMLMQQRLLEATDAEHDSIRIYKLPAGSFNKAEHLGHSPPAPHNTPLVF